MIYKLAAQLAGSLDKWGENFGDRTKTKVIAFKIAKIAWAVIRAVIMLGLSFILLYPLFYMVSMAFRPTDEIFDPTVIWIPRNFTLVNISRAINTIKYFETLAQTAVIGLVSSFIQVVSCAFTGYGFARFNFRLRGLLFIFVLINIIIPPQSMIIPQFLMNSKFDFFGAVPLLNAVGVRARPVNILDTVLPFYFPALFGHGIRSGLLIYIYRQFFRGMPKELEDAACIDGAGPLKTFLRVMAPNAGAAFLTVFLFSTVWYWNDYYYSSMFLSNSQTLSVRLSFLPNYLRTTSQFVDDPFQYITQIQAACLLTILPVLLVYIVFQRYFTESIEKTGIVG